MRKLLAAAFAAILVGLALIWTQPPAGAWLVQAPAAAASYTGPIDAAGTSALIWYSCSYAGSAAWATANGNLCDIHISGKTNCTLSAATSGKADFTVSTPCAGSTVLAWATRSTLTASVTGTTMTTSGGDPCTATAGDQLVNSGITTVTTIVSVTSCAAGVGSYAISQTFTPSGSVIDAYPTSVSKSYDQSGNANDTNAGSSDFWISCINGSPCYGFSSASEHLTSTNSISPATFVCSFVADRTGNTSAYNEPLWFGANTACGFNNTANQAMVFAGTVLAASANDNAFHAVNGVLNASASNSTINVDGSTTTGAAGNSAGASNFSLGATTGGANPFAGYMPEAGLFSGTSASPTALHTNQSSRYGTP